MQIFDILLPHELLEFKGLFHTERFLIEIKKFLKNIHAGYYIREIYVYSRQSTTDYIPYRVSYKIEPMPDSTDALEYFINNVLEKA